MQDNLAVNSNHGLDHQTSPERQNIQEVTQAHTSPQLDRTMLSSLLRAHWENNQIVPDKTELQFNGQSIDLSVLYSEVYNLGGSTNAQRRDLWAVVSKKMNLDQVGVGMSTDQITKHLKYIYDKYLSQFDLSASVAMRKTIEGGDRNLPPATEQDVQNLIIMMNNMNVQQQQQQQQQVTKQELSDLNHLSVEQLCQSGYDEQVIRLIEAQRPQLTQFQAQHQLPMSNVPQPGTSTRSSIPGSNSASRQPDQDGMQNFNQHGVPLTGQQSLNQFPFQTNGAFDSIPEDVRQGVMQGQGQQTMAQQQLAANGTVANPMVANTLPNSNSIQSSSDMQRKLQMVKQEIDLERQRLASFKATNPNADNNPLFKQRLNNLQQRETLFKNHLMALHRQGAGNSQIQQGLPPPPPPAGSNASTEMSAAASAFVKSLAHLTPEQQAMLNKLPVPTPDLLREATAYMVETKQQISISNNLGPFPMPNDRAQFDRDFDLLYREVQRISSLLPLYLSVTKEEKVAKAVTMQMDIVEKQRSRLNQQTPSYILNSDLLTRLRQQAAFLYQKIAIVCQFVKYRGLGEMVIEANLHPQEWEV